MLPGVPEALSITDTAYVLGVSKQTVERMIQAKELTLDPEERISKAGLVSYISHHILADLPVL
jgi:hypothetical protein